MQASQGRGVRSFHGSNSRTRRRQGAAPPAQLQAARVSVHFMVATSLRDAGKVQRRLHRSGTAPLLYSTLAHERPSAAIVSRGVKILDRYRCPAQCLNHDDDTAAAMAARAPASFEMYQALQRLNTKRGSTHIADLVWEEAWPWQRRELFRMERVAVEAEHRRRIRPECGGLGLGTDDEASNVPLRLGLRYARPKSTGPSSGLATSQARIALPGSPPVRHTLHRRHVPGSELWWRAVTGDEYEEARLTRLKEEAAAAEVAAAAAAVVAKAKEQARREREREIVVVVRRIQAFDIPDADEIAGGSDPLCQFKVLNDGGKNMARSTGRTKKILNQVNPDWPDVIELLLPLGSPARDTLVPTLEIHLYDGDLRFDKGLQAIAGSDEPLGVCEELTIPGGRVGATGSVSRATLRGVDGFDDCTCSFQWSIVARAVSGTGEGRRKASPAASRDGSLSAKRPGMVGSMHSSVDGSVHGSVHGCGSPGVPGGVQQGAVAEGGGRWSHGEWGSTRHGRASRETREVDMGRDEARDPWGGSTCTVAHVAGHPPHPAALSPLQPLHREMESEKQRVERILDAVDDARVSHNACVLLSSSLLSD